jgi:hypothetical protein
LTYLANIDLIAKASTMALYGAEESFHCVIYICAIYILTSK